MEDILMKKYVCTVCGYIAEGSIPEPVSYTHLDVYKRQAQDIEKRRWN